MMKNWKMLLTAAFVATLFALPGAASAQVCGDANLSGGFSLADCSLLSQCVAGLTTTCVDDALDESDFNDDGSIDAADLVACVFVQAGLETLFDPCTGAGAVRACAGAADPDTGLPTATIPSITIATSEIWANTCTYYLDGTVFVQTPANGDTVVLTIQPGTVIKGIKGSVDPGALIFLTTDENGDDVPDRTAKINAVGTPASPIVFTSDQAVGDRAKGDWAGVAFNGRSTVNRPNCVAQAEGLPTTFGGCRTEDSSGIARFVRAEYGGLDFTPDNELNLWTMNGIGSGTDFDFIHANVGDDDCHEWFGGTSKHTNLVASNCGDDMFDCQLGWTGSLQFGVAFQNGSITDSGGDSRGLECDNSEFGNNDLPRTAPKFCNVTFTGGRSGEGQVDNTGTDSGLLIRRGATGDYRNIIVEGFTDSGLELRDSATASQACTSPGVLAGNLDLQSVIFIDNGAVGTPEQAKSGGLSGGTCDGGSGDTPGFYAALVAAGKDILPADPTTNPADPGISRTPPTGDPDGVGGPGLSDMPLLAPTAPGNLPPAATCSDLDETFVDVGYVGAIDPAATCTGSTCGWLQAPWLDFAFE